jgi:hypothetical protein
MALAYVSLLPACFATAATLIPAIVGVSASRWFPLYCLQSQVELTVVALDAQMIRVPNTEMNLRGLRDHEGIGRRIVVCEHLNQASVQVREWIRTLGLGLTVAVAYFLLVHLSELDEPASAVIKGIVVVSAGALFGVLAIAESFRKEVLMYSGLFVAVPPSDSGGGVHRHRAPWLVLVWRKTVDIKKVTVGKGAKAGDVTFGDKTEGDKSGGNKIVQAVVGDRSAATLTDVLSKLSPAIDGMSDKLDAEGQRRTRRDFATFRDEVTSPEPRPEMVQAAGRGLLDTAKKIGEAAKPVMDLVELALRIYGASRG